jgi:hypothetical protein
MMYNWLSRSKKDEAAHLEGASPFYISIDPHGWDYWNNHMKRSRAAFILGMEASIRDQVANGIEEICYDPATGRPLLALNPEFIGVTNEQMEGQFLNPAIDRYVWVRDAEGNRVRPVYQTKIVQAPSQLKVKALSALLPKTYGERAQVEHNIRGAVVHIMEPPPFVSRQPQGQVIDGEFTEAPALPAPERDDIAELRHRAAELMANGPKNPRPDSPVKDATGHPVGRPRDESKPTRENNTPPAPGPRAMVDHPRAYRVERPKPKPTPPSYAGRPGIDPRRDPHNPNNRVMPAHRVIK